MSGSEVLTLIEKAIDEMPEQDRPGVVLALVGKIISIGSRTSQGTRPDDNVGQHHGDRLLDVTEIGQKLGKSKDWVYRNWRRLPFTMRLGGSIKGSERGANEYIARATAKSARSFR